MKPEEDDDRNRVENNGDKRVASPLFGSIFDGPDLTTTGDGRDLTKGSMIIESFSVPATYWGFSVAENEKLGLTGAAAAGLANVPAGTLGMKFLLPNPALLAMALLPPVVGLSGARNDNFRLPLGVVA